MKIDSKKSNKNHEENSEIKNKTKKNKQQNAKLNNAEYIKLSSLIERKDEENKKYLEEIKYLQAEIENNKKRYKKEIESIKSYAITNFSKKILSIIDSIEQGINHSRNKPDIKNIEEGLVMSHKIFLSVLKEFKILTIDSDNQIFNPEKHEAISIVNDKKEKNNLILQTLQKGYTIDERVLRTAKVVVCKNN